MIPNDTETIYSPHSYTEEMRRGLGSCYGHNLSAERFRILLRELERDAQRSRKGQELYVTRCSPVFTGMSDAAIMELNLPTGIPIVYELDKDLKPIKPMQFLGDEETVRKAMEAVAAQGKVKK